MSKTAFVLGTASIAALVLAGCGHTTTREIVTPVPVATAPQPAVIVASNTLPPAPRVEVRPAAPGTDYVWQSGYWMLVNGQYQWVPGHWEAKLLN
jgi:hypothetical protein